MNVIPYDFRILPKLIVVYSANFSIMSIANTNTYPKAFIIASPIVILPIAGSTSTNESTNTLFVKLDNLITNPCSIKTLQLISLGCVLIVKALYILESPFLGQNTSKAPINFKLSPFSFETDT